MVRKIAFEILKNVIIKGETLKVQNFDHNLEINDRAFLKLLVYSVFRRINKLDNIIRKFVKKSPDKETKIVLYLGISQILFLNVPLHAAIFETVEMVKKSKIRAKAGFINGVLRSLSNDMEIPKVSNFPDGFYRLLKNEYNVKTIEKMSNYMEIEPALDISVKNDVEFFANELNAKIMGGNNIRLNEPTLIPLLKGYDAGKWWVQSFASSLPVGLFSDLKGKIVADFCAAPGGKTSQMLAIGAKVDAFDISKKRLETLKQNIQRLNFEVNVINADPTTFVFDKKYDAILLDAPCSGTGTFRKNPDVVLKTIDFEKINEIQSKLLETALLNVKINGEVVFSTCSLIRKEGELLVRGVLNNFKNCSLMKENRVLPDDIYGEGFYMALIKRND